MKLLRCLADCWRKCLGRPLKYAEYSIGTPEFTLEVRQKLVRRLRARFRRPDAGTRTE
jgi:hypothetical protein